MKEKKIYEANEVKRIHSERKQKKQEARDAKCDVAVNKVASWITQRLEKSECSYLKIKLSSIRRKLGKWAWPWNMEECLRAYGYEVRRIRVKEKRWWSYTVVEVDYYVIGYNKEHIDCAFPN